MNERNLWELYPHTYKIDTYVEVSDDMLEAIKAHERAEAARERKMYRYKAHYSLDRGDRIEHDALYQPPTSKETILDQTIRSCMLPLWSCQKSRQRGSMLIFILA